jgi:ribosomal protein L16 Arg81 hydroxylase
MIDFDALLAPIGREEFFRRYYRKEPAFARSSAVRRSIFSFEQLNLALAQSDYWTENTLKLWLDAAPISSGRYCTPMTTITGERILPDYRKVSYWLGEGASLVLNGADNLTPELRSVAAALESVIPGGVWANIYCSFGGRRAFESHYDDHEVFAVHVAGEKTWRVYEGRMDNPVGQPASRPDLQKQHDAAKGKILFEKVMRPGDLMYLPRGQYHDALASSAASLHVTFSVAPMNGLALFSLLEKEAMRDSAFRDDLPLPHDGEALHKRLELLGEKFARICAQDSFAQAAREAQLSGRRPRAAYALPELSKEATYCIAGPAVRLARDSSGLVIADGAKVLLRIEQQSTPLCKWALAAGEFSRADAEAQFPFLTREQIEKELAALAGAGALTERGSSPTHPPKG